MGANKPGDIKELTEIAEPDYGIITNIGTAHIEGFGSKEGVVKTKKELYDTIALLNGKLFINKHDQLLMDIAPKVDQILYDLDTTTVSANPESLSVSFDYEGIHFETNLVGSYNAINAVVGIVIAKEFGVSYEQSKHALKNYVPTNNRSQLVRTERNTVIADMYNANPTSVKAAINELAKVKDRACFAIIGDMLELGSISTEEHQSTLDLLNTLNIPHLFVGQEFKKVDTEAVTTVEEAFTVAQNLSDKLVLLKGSRGIQLEKLLEHL
jgi:UDP-N-acetylmuramoyl-tripeptide--D-alanyl-D-alanine ligase